MISKHRVWVLASLCALLTPLFVSLPGNVNGAVMTGVTFVHSPNDYNNQTGSFNLGESICGAGHRNDGGACIQFDYFLFSATAGQVLQGQLRTSGQVINYAILTWKQFQVAESYGQSSLFATAGQVQIFTTPPTLNWVVSQDGQYVLVFFTRMSYSGDIYFIQ